MQPGRSSGALVLDYYRHGTTTLFAALEIATGQVTAASARPGTATRSSWLPQAGRAGLPRRGRRGHRRAGRAASGDGQLRRPQTPESAAWLAANPRFKVHFTPTHASWMNLVEVWFGIVERQAMRRGVFATSVP